jgi:hypothetical protein
MIYLTGLSIGAFSPLNHQIWCTRQLLLRVMGNAGMSAADYSGGWVIDQVNAELAALGYLQQTVVRNRLGLRKVQASPTANGSRPWRKTAPSRSTDGPGPGLPTCRSAKPCSPNA